MIVERSVARAEELVFVIKANKASSRQPLRVLKTKVVAPFNMSTHMVYKAELEGKVYFGCTTRSLQARGEDLRLRPVFWLRDCADVGQVQLTPMFHRRVDLQTALRLEAAFTAELWQKHPSLVRGGPWCVRHLNAGLVSELETVAQVNIQDK
jgi:hypothetical protein